MGMQLSALKQGIEDSIRGKQSLLADNAWLSGVMAVFEASASQVELTMFRRLKPAS